VTQFGDTAPRTEVRSGEKKNMSEYYLADHKIAERDRQRQRERDIEKRPEAREFKATLLGDFMSPTLEPQGCDPYNSTGGKPVPEVWSARRARR
jgi:hypothetical protein